MASAVPPRISSLSAELRSRGWDAFLAWSPTAMGYLSGFFEGSHERFMALVVGANGAFELIAPSLSVAQAQRAGLTSVAGWSDGEDPYRLLVGLAARFGFTEGTVAVDMEMPAHMVLGIQGVLPKAKLVVGEPAISELRRIKADREVDAMRRAGAIADQSYEQVLNRIRPGVTEREIQAALEGEMGSLGGKPTFCTVAFGPGSAEPHHISDDTVLQEGQIVLMDFGCDVDHYQSDITRTVCCGRADDEMKRVYRIVFEAHQAARAAIGPGATCQDVDRAARKVIEAAGFGPNFFHRVGHGIGMEVHEAPYMVEGNSDLIRPGECFSIEPGVYFEGQWGIRIENIVTATANGHDSMNKEPSPDLVEIGA